MNAWTRAVMTSSSEGDRPKLTSTPSLFLDVGANLGVHGLYAAALGCHVWFVEPQIKNIEKVHF